MTTFQDMQLPESLLQTLAKMNFTQPTEIQEKAIPVALSGKDILGSAQTGTGKTGAFGIPLIAKVMSNPKSLALVMTPTRELATQVMTQLKAMLGHRSPIKTALLIGGDSMPKQFRQLHAGPRIIVGTPGRINDHLQRQSLNLRHADFLVLDETDRMLDMGFSIQINEIMRYMTAQRQTLLFSATLPKNITNIAAKYLNNPERIAVKPKDVTAANITQDIKHLRDAEKYDELLNQLNERDGSIIIFVKTKFGADKMAHNLYKDGHLAAAIHGNLKQNKRDRVISAFRQKKHRILVATDIAARGLDIPHIEHVINYDLPQCAEDYVHRIGRTARAGAKGFALNFISPADKRKWQAIERLLNPEAHKNQSAEKRHGAPKKRFNGHKKRANFSRKDGDKQPRFFKKKSQGQNGRSRQSRQYA